MPLIRHTHTWSKSLKEGLRQAHAGISQISVASTASVTHQDEMFLHQDKPDLSYVLSTLQGFQQVAAVSPLPFLAPAFAAVNQLISKIMDADSNHASGQDLSCRISAYVEAINGYTTCSDSASPNSLTRKHIDDIIGSLTKIQEDTKKMTNQKSFWSFINSSTDKEALEELARKLENARNLFFLELIFALMKKIDALHGGEDCSHNKSQTSRTSIYSYRGCHPSPSYQEVSHHSQISHSGLIHMPVPDIDINPRYAWVYEAASVRMPTPEPYYAPSQAIY